MQDELYSQRSTFFPLCLLSNKSIENYVLRISLTFIQLFLRIQGVAFISPSTHP